MRAWTSPSVPSLADRGLGTGPAPTVHDTASGSRLALAPEGRARMYVCGITPYDATHLGHAATMLAFDVLQRVWRDSGRSVTYVQNVTDVDDPLLERAERDGVAWADLAAREVELYRQDMEALRVLAPDHYPGVVESMDRVAATVVRLRDVGAAYAVDRDLYFDRSAEPAFGAVSGLDDEHMRALFGERGGDPDRPGKRDPLDWLLWRAERPGEPAWDSALGRGRPGWHVECAAMADEHLGLGFDVQGGGSDLAFPHHEMSAAEAQTAHRHRAPFARAYVHAGMVGLGGEKMSKSRGNLVLVSVLRADGVDPVALRLALLGHHYRADWTWTDGDLAAARSRLHCWRAAAAVAGATADPLSDALGSGDTAGDPGGDPEDDDAATVVDAVRAALADDLDTPRALAVLDAWAARVGDQGDSGRGRRADPDAVDPEAAGARTVALAADALLGVAL